MVERDGFPVAFPVTGGAFLSIGSFMFVILLMAGITVRWSVLEGRRQMTLLAFHGGMFSHERETRLVVVEGGLLPRPVIMTFLTLRSLLPFVLVILLMAGIAIHRGVLIAVACMAFLARHVHVLMSEFVAGLVVVEPDILPITVGVAVVARRSYFPLMFVVLLVAAIAVRRRITKLAFGSVARLALDLPGVCVGPLQREVRTFMIEGLFRDRRDVLRSAFVFGMAIFALPLLFEASV